MQAAPLKRAEHGKVLKRKRCTEELVGRLVKKEFKEGVFKVESRLFRLCGHRWSVLRS